MNIKYYIVLKLRDRTKTDLVHAKYEEIVKKLSLSIL